MGLGAVDYALHCDRRPKQLIVTDINEDRLQRARKLFPKDAAKASGIDLEFINTAKMDNVATTLKEIAEGGFDDVFVYAPVQEVVELASAILARDGCLNFFAGPQDSNFQAKLNFYDVHYNSTHVIGTTGGNTQDMIEALELSSSKRTMPAVMVTHIGGLDVAKEATLHLPQIPGGKKLIYTHIEMPLTAIDEFQSMATADPRFGILDEIVKANNGLWCAQAEDYLMKHW